MSEDSIITILAVDDEKTNLNILFKILNEEYKLLLAKTGESALTIAAEKRPDLILLDIILPDMSGFDVLVALKNSEITRGIPVIFITGLDNARDEAKGFLLGAVDYITKPFDNTVVKARVNTHVQIIKQIRTIERLTLLDPLTEIPNRRKFTSQINEVWEKAVKNLKPISMLMLDVDKFKQYNDTYGHPQGDVLLKSFAKLFLNTLRLPPDMVARMGGEEFAVILPNMDTVEAFECAEKIRKAAEEARVPRLSDNTPTSATVSIGLATAMPSSGGTIEQLITNADTALYTAKNTGRNKVSS